MLRFLLPLGLLLVSGFTPTARAADVIGFIYSGGEYQSDGAGVRGNATLFDGGTVETRDATARIQLNNGARIWLAPGARATMSARTVRLLAGLGQFEPKAGYAMEARAVRIGSSQPGAIVRVQLDRSGGTIVEPVKGSVDVTNSRGTTVGKLGEGAAVRFADERADPNKVDVSGCVYADGDQFRLTDAVTNVAIQLRGKGLEGQVGHFVSISGVETEPSRTLQTIHVTGFHRLASGSCASSPAVRSVPLLAVAKRDSNEGPFQSAPKLNLLIVEGEGAINNIRQRTAREPVVEVQDENHRPVAGALVLFALPRGGASGTFANGSATLQVSTDAQGRAVASGLRPNNVAGQFEIAVSASYGGLTATAVIRQVNAVGMASSAGAPDSTATASKSGAASASQGAGAGTHAATGMAIGTKLAIIGGISASAVVGGLAAAGTFGSGTEPPASR